MFILMLDFWNDTGLRQQHYCSKTNIKIVTPSSKLKASDLYGLDQ